MELKFLAGSVGLALLLMASSAEADIRVTLTSDGFSQTQTSTGTANPNMFLGIFSVGNYALEIQTALVTLPASNGGIGQLASTSIVGNTIGIGTLAPLTVTVQDINPNGTLATFGSSSPTDYNVQNSASVTSPLPTTLLLTGSAQINAANPNVAPVGLFLPGSVSGSTSNNQTVTGVSGYTLSQNYTLSMISGGTTGLTVGFNTSVSPLAGTGTAVPEPSSIVLTGLVAIGLGGVGLRRRLWSRPRSCV